MNEFNCNGTSRFINSIYDFLADENICFLSGSIVIDDDLGKLFNSLYKGNQSFLHSYKCENTSESRTVGSIVGGTHAAFINDKRFKAARNSKPTDFSLKSFGNTQYEKILDPKLTHICKKACAVKKCDKTEEFPKGVVLFYPFEIHSEDLSIKHRFLFMKLEEFTYNDIAHMGKAWDRYILKREKGDRYPKKREDPGKGKINNDLVEKDKWAMVEFVRIYKNEELALKVHEKINFYNENVRVGNETYIPSEIILLLHITNESEDQIRSAQLAGKKYKDSSKKMGEECVSSYWTRDQLYFMAKVMKLPVSKNMTKSQLCTHLTTYRQTGGIKTAILNSVRKKRDMRSYINEYNEESPMKRFLKPVSLMDLSPKKLFENNGESWV